MRSNVLVNSQWEFLTNISLFKSARSSIACGILPHSFCTWFSCVILEIWILWNSLKTPSLNISSSAPVLCSPLPRRPFSKDTFIIFWQRQKCFSFSVQWGFGARQGRKSSKVARELCGFENLAFKLKVICVSSPFTPTERKKRPNGLCARCGRDGNSPPNHLIHSKCLNPCRAAKKIAISTASWKNLFWARRRRGNNRPNEIVKCHAHIDNEQWIFSSKQPSLNTQIKRGACAKRKYVSQTEKNTIFLAIKNIIKETFQDFFLVLHTQLKPCFFSLVKKHRVV